MGQTVVIVDDHAGFRASARRMLEADGFEVVGEAQDGATALATVRDLRPDIVLLDVRLPDMSGMAVAGELARDDEAPAIVLVSSHDREDYGDSIESSGACGFVPKDRLSGAALAAAVA